MFPKDEFKDEDRWVSSPSRQDAEKQITGILIRRMQKGRECLLANAAGSWQRKPRRRPKSCCLLLSPAITASNIAAWPPQRLQSCDAEKHTQKHAGTTSSKHPLLLWACSAWEGRRRVQMRAQPLSQSHKTSWPATDTHSQALTPLLHSHSAGQERGRLREPGQQRKRRQERFAFSDRDY